MWEGSYGKEPFDLRLAVLRLIKNIPVITAVTVLGTLLFGGGYYVKNVLLYRDHFYAATSTYRVEYTEEPTQSGDYYINEMSWNTYVESQEFYKAVIGHLGEITKELSYVYPLSKDRYVEEVEAFLASDWHVPSTVVTTELEGWSVYIAQAVEQTMIQEFVESNPQVLRVTVIDPAVTAVEVLPDVRPFRAVILSAVLSCFFAVVIFLLRELGVDSIWLPATLRQRYGLATMGTIHSAELLPNLEYRFAKAERIAVCAVDEHIDPVEVCGAIRERGDGSTLMGKEWVPVPAPFLCGESCDSMRCMDAVLLVIGAGSHVGKPLERALGYLTEQEIKITGAILWEADERLIRTYYRIPFAPNVEDIPSKREGRL